MRLICSLQVFDKRIMEKLNYPCPCGGKVKWKKEKVVQDGIDCGVLDVEYCDTCGEMYSNCELFSNICSQLLISKCVK